MRSYMSWEYRTSGLFVVHIDHDMSLRDVQGYGEFVGRIMDLPMGSRYRAIASLKKACYEAVEIWKKLQPALDEWKLGDQWFVFNHQVRDELGFLEAGQDMLRARLDSSENILVADVAGYLFGYSYEQMLIAAGSPDYVSRQVTQHYSKKHPGLIATARGKK